MSILPQPERRYSWAELLDRYAILRVRRARAPERSAEASGELCILDAEIDPLMASLLEHAPGTAGALTTLRQELLLANSHLWDLIEVVVDPAEPDSTVTEAARELQRHNARRTRLKNEISALLGNGVPEHKTYAEALRDGPSGTSSGQAR